MHLQNLTLLFVPLGTFSGGLNVTQDADMVLSPGLVRTAE